MLKTINLIILIILLISPLLLKGQVTRFDGIVFKYYPMSVVGILKEPSDSLKLDFRKSFNGNLKFFFNDSLICKFDRIKRSADYPIEHCSTLSKDLLDDDVNIIRIQFDNKYIEEVVRKDISFIEVFYIRRDRTIDLYFEQ